MNGFARPECCLVRQPVRDEATARTRLAGLDLVSSIGPLPDAPPAEATGNPDLATVAAFLGPDGTGDRAVVWYLEFAEPAHPPPADVVAAATGAWPDALGAPTVPGDDGGSGTDVLVHATLPDRRVPSDADPDVVLLRLELRPLGDRLVRALARATGAAAGTIVERGVLRLAAPVLAAESMYTETLFCEGAPTGAVLWWVMEAADMAGVGEAYYASRNPLARLSEGVLGRILTRPEKALVDPIEHGEFECVLHAASPDR